MKMYPAEKNRGSRRPDRHRRVKSPSQISIMVAPRVSHAMLPAMRRYSFLALAVLCLSTLPAFAQQAARVTDLRMMRDPSRQTRLELDITAAVPYRSFVLNNPPRLVIDLPNMGWSAPMNKGDRNGYVRSYRRGTFQKDTLRLVFDLNKPVIVAQQSRITPAAGRPWRYIFDLKPVNPIQFQQAINKVNVGGGAPVTATQNAAPTPAPSVPDAVATPAHMPAAKQIAKTIEKKPLVILDAGHGGVDPGAIASNGAREKNITLAVAQEVKRQLLATGRYRVQMTRDSDIFVKLPDRVRIARRAGADLFISLHADTVPRPQVHGASVYTLSDKASDIETAKLAERENAVDTLVNVDVGHVDADVADILIDLVTRDTMNQSKVLAETVVSTFHQKGVSTLPQRPHRSAGFAVLKAPDIPSVLIEMGFLSNRQEADMLTSATHRQKLGKAITGVVDRYFNETSKTAAY